MVSGWWDDRFIEERAQMAVRTNTDEALLRAQQVSRELRANAPVRPVEKRVASKPKSAQKPEGSFQWRDINYRNAYSLRNAKTAGVAAILLALIPFAIWQPLGWAVFIIVFTVFWFVGLFEVLYCPHCKKRVKQGAEACHHCGRSVK